MKAILIIALLLVLAALASAGVFMLRKDDAASGPRDKKMARALAVRVGLSVALFLFILLSWHFGWIEPKGIPLSR
ncbi:MAG: twin transmembrane helix small protein [Pseudomonadota bacterium]